MHEMHFSQDPPRPRKHTIFSFFFFFPPFQCAFCDKHWYNLITCDPWFVFGINMQHQIHVPLYPANSVNIALEERWVCLTRLGAHCQANLWSAYKCYWKSIIVWNIPVPTQLCKLCIFYLVYLSLLFHLLFCRWKWILVFKIFRMHI